MAGVLLLIAKHKRKEDFVEARNKLKKIINASFASYFKKIIYHEKSSEYVLIEFRKDSRSKYFEDASGSWLVYEGSVFALEETKSLSAANLWDLYKKNGENFADKLDGHFVIKLYDAKRDVFLVLNDIIKAKTNYITETEEFILFTPFLLTCSALKKPAVDLNALNEYLWRYYILSYKTLYADVQRLEPAAIYKVDGNKLSKKKYWEFPKALTSLTYQQSVDAFVESIQETARLINSAYGKVSSDLTQGQDSRIIVTAFLKQNLPITTTIFGEDDFSEVKNVNHITQRHNIDHHNLKIQDDFKNNIWEYFKRAAILGSGDGPGYLLGRILHMRDQQSAYGNVLLNGAGGPFYKDCFWEEVYALNLYREPSEIDLKQFLRLRPMNKNYRDFFFNEKYMHVKEQSEEYFLDMLDDSIIGYTQLPVSMQIDKFALYKWQNYALNGNNISNIAYDSISPLLLRRNLEIGLSMPPNWRWNKSKFQRSVMYKLNPELAKEKTDFGGINMVPKHGIGFIPFYFRYVFKQTERMRNKMMTKFGFKVTTHLQAAWDYIPIYQRLLEDENLKNLLKFENMSLAEYLDEEKWMQYLHDFNNRNQGQSDYEQILKLATVELLLSNPASII